MGVKKLNSFVTQNINFSKVKWDINQKKFFTLMKKGLKGIDKNVSEKKNSNSNELNLFIDANALFYHIGNQINWFNFDTLHFLKVLQKVRSI